MKKLLILTLAALTSTSTFAFEIIPGTGKGGLHCRSNENQLLEVVAFAPSADSTSSKGICTVKAEAYSSWDLAQNDIAHVIKAEAGICDSQKFMEHDGKMFVVGSVSYKHTTSRCGSAIGCMHTCQPQITLSPF